MWGIFLIRILLIVMIGLVSARSYGDSLPELDPEMWVEGFPVPVDGRPNPYELSEAEQADWIRRGRSHALRYPVEVTGLQIPAETLSLVFQKDLSHPLLALVGVLLNATRRFDSQDDMEAWLGLSPYPDEEGRGAYFVPFPDGQRPAFRMGSTLLSSALGSDRAGLTYSCAACHVSDFFGRKVVGLSARFPRANEFFLAGRKLATSIPASWIGPQLGIPKDDLGLARQMAKRARAVDGVAPLELGLDTSLAHVALSLSRRAEDPLASFNEYFEKSPRPNVLRHARADSKPAVWWNLKFKNRWLSDGSVVSGNPIFTNILWNEIGRGTDLRDLQSWLEANESIVNELTAAVFASEAPQWLDVFPRETVDAQLARKGAVIYRETCARCHGSVEKNWDLPEFEAINLNELSDDDLRFAISTSRYRYFSQTPVLDVGTDAARALGMQGLLALNDLEISEQFGTVIRPSNGYVPPPLVGIFSRYPYLHNNSIANLCELLKPAEQRAQKYLARPAVNPATDFDFACVGYPAASPQEMNDRQLSDFVFDTSSQGLSAKGHDEGIFSMNGKSLLSVADQKNLIEFLKTL